MKVTLAQQTSLQQYLESLLTYRETYEETYDHVLTALEKRDLDGTFAEAVNQVIAEEFGGYKQMIKMERVVRAAELKSYARKFVTCIVTALSGSQGILTLSLCVLGWLFCRIQLSGWQVEFSFAVLAFTPLFIMFYRYYRLGYIYEDNKPSIHDSIFKILAKIPQNTFVFCSIWFAGSFGHALWLHYQSIWMTGLVVLAIIYDRAYLLLYQQESMDNAVASQT